MWLPSSNGVQNRLGQHSSPGWSQRVEGQASTTKEQPLEITLKLGHIINPLPILELPWRGGSVECFRNTMWFLFHFKTPALWIENTPEFLCFQILPTGSYHAKFSSSLVWGCFPLSSCLLFRRCSPPPSFLPSWNALRGSRSVFLQEFLSANIHNLLHLARYHTEFWRWM